MSDEKPDSIADDLATALAEQESPETPDAPATAAPAERPEGEPASDTPGDQNAPAAPETPGAKPAPETPGGAVEAPHHWPAADREMFAKQTPEAKSWLLKRHQAMEADYTKKMESVGPARRLQDGIAEIFAPHRQAMRLAGTDELAAIRQLAAAHDYLQEKPDEAIVWLAQKYGIDLNKAVSGGAEGQPPDDPRYKELNDKFTQLDKTLRSTLSAQQQEQFNASLSQVEKFADEKDAQGQIAHPHFDEVAKDVSRLIKLSREDGATLSLQDAYDRAIYANPSTRAKMFAAEQAKRTAAEEKERKAKADAARRASSGEVRGEGAASPGAATSKDNLREELSANYDRLAGNARV